MSKKIPFLQMFAMLAYWPELAQAAEGWVIITAAIDKATRSARVALEGAEGAGANLLHQVEEALSKAYGLTSVKLDSAPAAPKAAPEPASVQEKTEPEQPVLTPTPEMDAFARTEAIRQEALKKLKQGRPKEPKKASNGNGKGKLLYGQHPIKQ